MAKNKNNKKPDVIPEGLPALPGGPPALPAGLPGGLPALPGGLPELPGTNGLTSSEMKADLKGKLGQVENLKREVNSNVVIKKNELEKGKARFVQGIMDFLVEMGVDPSSPESIRDFLVNLEQTDPDMAAIFAFSFDRLVPAGEGELLPEDPQGLPPQGLPPGGPGAPPLGIPSLPLEGGLPPGAPPLGAPGLPPGGGFPPVPVSPQGAPGLPPGLL